MFIETRLSLTTSTAVCGMPVLCPANSAAACTHAHVECLSQGGRLTAARVSLTTLLALPRPVARGSDRGCTSFDVQRYEHTYV